MYKLMLVEDDLTITEVLERQLTKWGYYVTTVTKFNQVLECFLEEKPDLVLMDITLPFFNGFYWCQEIRKVSSAPIIFISSANEDMNLVMAINMGADDFVAKPFTMEVITAKIQALLRRTYAFKQDASTYKVKGAVLNLADNTISHGSHQVNLSGNEFKILSILMQNKGKTVSRETIMEQLWDSNEFVDDNTLTVNIARIRKKLEEIELYDFIETKKGLGYFVGE